MLQMSAVAVVVRDAQAAAQWWHDKVGFEVVNTEGHYVTVRAPGSTTLLHMCETEPKESGNSGIGFHSKDVARDAAQMEKKGVRFSQPVTKAAWGTFAKFLDPDGNEFWLGEG